MAQFSDKLIRVPSQVDAKIQRVCKRLQREKRQNKDVPRHEAIEVMADFYLLEGGDK